MKIAVINSGSSSIKFKLFYHHTLELLAHIHLEKIGESYSVVTLKYSSGEKVFNTVIRDHEEGLEQIASLLAKEHILEDFSSLDAIAHRVVHGGEYFREATFITEDVIGKIEGLIPLAPLHNRANLEGIRISMQKAPKAPQIAVFDTAFHETMPKEAYMYALKHSMYDEHKIRRYGFHGSSHAYVLSEAAKLLGKEANELNVITLHLGNGSSACAILKGKSIDTSMGFTPLEGLVMGTRSGDIDPAVVLYMQRVLGLSVDEVDRILNEESGLVGICGIKDVRTILEQEDEASKLAIAMMVRRIKKYIGAYMALLGDVDAIVFTGGIGENSAVIRRKVLENIGFGIVLEREQNIRNARSISAPQSSIALLVIPTDEELEIAKESLKLLEKKQTPSVK
ncbi:MAG: acetate kinase [Campylobacterales bacterium]|nr:acetate kinase [Campylobacterales bacterium]HEO99059.1 acetate kinase [Campylobacterota bacterium]